MDILDAIKERRSATFFDAARPVPEGLLREIIETANLSPSSFNLQPWRVVVVRDEGRRKVLRKCALDQSKIEEAPVTLIIIADPHIETTLDPMLDSWESLGYIRNDTRPLILDMVSRRWGTEDSPERTICAVKNTALFAMTLMLAARGVGLETHAMDGFDDVPLKEAFSIPEDKVVLMLIAMGYLKPGVTLLPRAFRKPFDSFTTFESY